MTSAREEILARVTSALGTDRQPPADLPQRARVTWDAGRTVDQFVETTADYRAIVERTVVNSLPQHIAAALAGASAASVIRPAGLDPSWLTGFPGTVLTDDHHTAYDLDSIDAVITAAAVGIAATGTVVLDHGPDQGRRAISLVPDVHVCVIRADQVVPDVPEATAALREAINERRPLTWISGPSATSDIELDRVEGVHGPRTLHVIIVDQDG
ncbi:LutC/YkgG family protein [Demetria terragena]|uniref:LutC/YkgG family protein n=1 Tax=Demetria terragena TaxID=63959 RepID=UPI00036DF073|nr:lactate utilization protein C [Demetria terragena]